MYVKLQDNLEVKGIESWNKTYIIFTIKERKTHNSFTINAYSISTA